MRTVDGWKPWEARGTWKASLVVRVNGRPLPVTMPDAQKHVGNAMPLEHGFSRDSRRILWEQLDTSIFGIHAKQYFGALEHNEEESQRSDGFTLTRSVLERLQHSV